MANPKKKVIEKGTTAISIRLPTDLYEQAKETSERTGVPVSFVARKALEEWVKQMKSFVFYDPNKPESE